jgi:heme-degrading monooxygenase HmoA
MFVVISHHWCKPGQAGVARERVDRNGAAMTAEPGFLYRYRIERAAQPDVVSTLTAWTAEADYQRFRGKRSGGGHDAPSLPWERIESEAYEVAAAHGKPPA